MRLIFWGTNGSCVKVEDATPSEASYFINSYLNKSTENRPVENSQVKRHIRHWTKEEHNKLRNMYLGGLKIKEIAKDLGRSKVSVYTRLMDSRRGKLSGKLGGVEFFIPRRGRKRFECLGLS